jgi:pilus assembly protein CpaF
MRDGISRVQSIAEIVGMEGEIITTRELFGFQYRGERHASGIQGSFESMRMRPDFIVRAARFGLERDLLDALGIGET